jgi:hypothetical protein
MSLPTRFAGLSFLTCAGALLAGVGLAAPAPRGPIVETFKDRNSFLPQRKYQALPGRAVGIVVSEVAPMMAHDGRYGPADAMGFSVNGNSYSWMYIPVADKPRITNLHVAVGEKGDAKKIYPQLDMANPAALKQWGIETPYALVEVEVNDGLAAPDDQAFVATKMKRLDGTKEYPLKVPEVVAELRKRYQSYLQDDKKTIDEAMAKEEKDALKDKKATGPRESTQLFYVTWMPESQHLRVCFRTRMSDGAYQFSEGGVRPRPVPLPLPPNRRPGAANAAPAVPPTAKKVPPPPHFRVRHGTTFGIEFGMAYEVDKSGKLVKTMKLPIEGFRQVIPPPPAFDAPRPPPLPPPPPPAPGKD